MNGTETIGQLFRNARAAKNHSLRKAAALMNVSPSYLSKVERDKEKPSAELVERYWQRFEPEARPIELWLIAAGHVVSFGVAWALCEKAVMLHNGIAEIQWSVCHDGGHYCAILSGPNEVVASGSDRSVDGATEKAFAQMENQKRFK